ncbi:MAG TPA: hypothetical protein VFQ61_11550 [Polyangiaceae bacterium]|nr:hypothetical protein [Polyangiaceae bacterium]
MPRFRYVSAFSCVVISALCSLPSHASAQEQAPGDKLQLNKPDLEGKPEAPPAPVSGAPKLVGLSFLAGGLLLDLGDLNDRLEATGHPNSVPGLFPTIGGQGFGLFSHFLIGGSGVGFLPRSTRGAGDTDVSVSGAWGSFDFGYQLIRKNGFLLAPIASIGGYGMTVNVGSRVDTRFDDALRSPGRGTTLTSKGVVGGISILANLILLSRKAPVDTAQSGWALGVRVGGLYGFPYRDWHADNGKASDGPTVGLRGAYAMASLSLGSW